jgi:hypothetical protein
MASIRYAAEQFFNACESGKGWEGCAQYCHPDATFSAQADALAGVNTLEAYTEWDEAPVHRCRMALRAAVVRRGRERGATSWRTASSAARIPEMAGRSANREERGSDYVYVMEFDGDTILHMTNIWNDGFALRQAGWA